MLEDSIDNRATVRFDSVIIHQRAAVLSMNARSVLQFLLLACAWICIAPTAHADEKTSAAIVAAKEWLGLVDSAKYQQSWLEAAPMFKQVVVEKFWVNQIASVRGPLGRVESREFIGAQFTSTLPGAPAGEYVVIQFKTHFAGKPDSVETVTPMWAEGAWRVSGYFIR